MSYSSFGNTTIDSKGQQWQLLRHICWQRPSELTEPTWRVPADPPLLRFRTRPKSMSFPSVALTCSPTGPSGTKCTGCSFSKFRVLGSAPFLINRRTASNCVTRYCRLAATWRAVFPLYAWRPRENDTREDRRLSQKQLKSLKKVQRGSFQLSCSSRVFLKVPLHSQKTGNWAVPKRGEWVPGLLLLLPDAGLCGHFYDPCQRQEGEDSEHLRPRPIYTLLTQPRLCLTHPRRLTWSAPFFTNPSFIPSSMTSHFSFEIPFSFACMPLITSTLIYQVAIKCRNRLHCFIEGCNIVQETIYCVSACVSRLGGHPVDWQLAISLTISTRL